MNRRNWLRSIVGGTAVTSLVMASDFTFAEPRETTNTKEESHPMQEKTLKKYDNSFFYKNGKFDQGAGKQAFRELLEYHSYSLPDVIDDSRFWVEDFGLNDFANVGMGGIFWLNDKEHGYFGHEIFLLPCQMIPEHAHEPADGMPAKHEYWQVRNGSIYNFSQGGSQNDPMPKDMALPKSQLDANAITCFKWQELTAKTGIGKGEAVLTGIGDWHFMMGGSKGAIVTEYACYHAPEGLKIRAKL